jgi:hypothetical protein
MLRFAMAEMSRFYGITVGMKPKEKGHNLPHFHARYNDYEVSITWTTGDLTVLAGNGPPTMMSTVFTWARQHLDEIIANWERLQNGKPVQKIEPLR